MKKGYFIIGMIHIGRAEPGSTGVTLLPKISGQYLLIIFAKNCNEKLRARRTGEASASPDFRG